MKLTLEPISPAQYSPGVLQAKKGNQPAILLRLPQLAFVYEHNVDDTPRLVAVSTCCTVTLIDRRLPLGEWQQVCDRCHIPAGSGSILSTAVTGSGGDGSDGLQE